MESTKSCSKRKTVYGKLRYLMGTINQKLFVTVILTIYNDIEKAIEKRAALDQKLKDRARGLITSVQSPTVTSVESQCKKILARQYMKEVIPYVVMKGQEGLPQLKSEIDTEAIERLADTYLGKNILVMNRKSWDNEQIIWVQSLFYDINC